MKKPKSRKKSASSAIIAVIVIIAISASAIYFYNHQKTSGDDNTAQWITSGPFAITNGTYRIDDNIFMVVTGLKPTDAGNIMVYDPEGAIYTKTPFNGTLKSDFNYFFKPNTERLAKICTPQDLVGNWTIDFPGTSYDPIHFKIINEWVQGGQAEIKSIPPPCP
ncbi:MAG: hypothetical protein WCC52_04390 [Nitrosotalea sp.]